MKNIVFVIFPILLTFSFATCSQISEPDDYYTNVTYSEDGSQVTIYLEGGVPVTEKSRALTAYIAEHSHDYYEVVFSDGTNYARASWQLGNSAVIQDVPRGLDYDSVTLTELATGHGAAILFVGRKSDKTLLAVGKLTETDTGSTEITADTKTVTFTVSALEGGLHVPGGVTVVDNNSPFTPITETVSETDITPSIEYPRFHLEDEGTYILTYKIALAGGNILDFNQGIINLGTGSATKRISAETSYGSITSNFNISSDAVLFNNKTVDGFTPDIIIDIEGICSAGDEGFFAVTFEIPVKAIHNSAVTDADTWHIRPGFSSYNYFLDDGKGRFGGAILFSIGENSSYFNTMTVAP